MVGAHSLPLAEGFVNRSADSQPHVIAYTADTYKGMADVSTKRKDTAATTPAEAKRARTSEPQVTFDIPANTNPAKTDLLELAADSAVGTILAPANAAAHTAGATPMCLLPFFASLSEVAQRCLVRQLAELHRAQRAGTGSADGSRAATPVPDGGCTPLHSGSPMRIFGSPGADGDGFEDEDLVNLFSDDGEDAEADVAEKKQAKANGSGSSSGSGSGNGKGELSETDVEKARLNILHRISAGK
ncbi:hypothetical protein TeGR_g8030 [Tetraparma gracilis]|uniref:Uncharacterized protein n=1 Tax=Tetraparma gracilis TaxID=2962635 RepID=A0ABQ6MQB6_9STRA|nr:hypothetical protein TeGR_g8030 [Tetraparma gracilis]